MKFIKNMKLKRKLKMMDWLNIVIILILIGFFLWVGMSYIEKFGKANSNDMLSFSENLRQYIISYGNIGLLITILMHSLHVIISFIPSVIVQFTGGLIYGMGWGMLSGFIGIPIGTAISFYISRFLGRRVIKLFVSDKTIDKMDNLISNDMSAIVLLILFILPTPKDFFAYFVGLTNMKALNFFLISIIGRLPGMLVATYLGAHVFNRNYMLIVSIAIVCSILSFLLFIFKNRIFYFLLSMNKIKLKKLK
ncbi:MAG: VTT domain-containing protein [Holophagales bacterium]|nr:VTT domain-containing protein [Holophagales bacterium]